jgi:PIN domain nuclease of toxin-antitoxin system
LILLDTQILIWFTQGDVRLGETARRIVSDEASNDEVVVSPISFWETSMLVWKSRLSLGLDALEWATAVLRQSAIRMEPISPVIAIDAGQLPGDIHGDPADRLIIATARSLSCPVLTTDRKILAYGDQGHVQAIDAR